MVIFAGPDGNCSSATSERSNVRRNKAARDQPEKKEGKTGKRRESIIKR